MAAVKPQPLDPEPIHGWFELTYSNYLVLNRSVLQSMPVEWQERFVQCLREVREAASDLKHPDRYRVCCLSSRGKFMPDPIPHYERGRTRVKLRKP